MAYKRIYYILLNSLFHVSIKVSVCLSRLTYSSQIVVTFYNVEIDITRHLIAWIHYLQADFGAKFILRWPARISPPGPENADVNFTLEGVFLLRLRLRLRLVGVVVQRPAQQCGIRLMSYMYTNILIEEGIAEYP